MSKESHAFPKAFRFKYERSPTEMVSNRSFDKLSDFDQTVRKGRNHKPSFDTTAIRFAYQKPKNVNHGPGSYETKDAFCGNSTFHTSKRFSIGNGRA